MAAPKKNKNAQRWTESIVMGYLIEIERAACDRKNLFLGQELVKLGLYKDVWCYWKRKFGQIEQLMEEMELIEQRFECNLFRAGMKGDIPERIAIICLKNIYGWRDDVRVEVPVIAMVQEEEYWFERGRLRRA
jgi:hypothetical protein